MRFFSKHLLLYALVVSLSWAQGNVPKVNSGGIVNAADYGPSIPTGAFFAIYGTNLAPRLVQAKTVPLPTQLDGVSVSVRISGQTVAAPLLFVSPQQINAQMPYGTGGKNVTVIVKTAAGSSNETVVKVDAVAPRFYTKTMDGRGEALLLRYPEYTLVSESAPALPGDVVMLYLSGLGEVSPPIAAGLKPGDGTTTPLNEVPVATVEVYVNAQRAQVFWAGLAPGWPGLYQINFQMPPTLPDGMAQIEVRCQTKRTQAPITVATAKRTAPGAEPEEVVRRALEAQVRGDVDGFLAECSTEGYAAEDVARARALLNVVRDHAVLSNFEFTHLATGRGDQRTLAIVRAYVSYTARAGGGTHSMRHGMLAFLKRSENRWKIVRLVPDDLLNQELYENAAAKQATAQFGQPRQAGAAINLQEFNKTINNLLNTLQVDEIKLGRSAAFAVIGQIPVVGDAMANVNQVVEAFENVLGGLYEVYQNGFTGIATLKFKQVGVGVLQIVTEAAPGLDAQADMVQAGLEQLAYNLELARSLNQLRSLISQIPSGSVQVTPYLYPYPAYRLKYPAGLEMLPMDKPPAHSYGVPLGTIGITAPTALDQKIPLMIVGEIPFPSGSLSASMALQLGGQERGGTTYFPVEVGYLAQSDASDGDIILDGYRRYRTADSVSRVVAWDVTCRRGIQLLRVALRNGETTPAVRVVADMMNRITALEVVGAGDRIEVAPKASVTGIKVLGTGPLLEKRFWPDLTARDQCLDIAIGNPDVASLDRGKTLTVNGIAPGETTLKMLLIGGTDAGVPELQGSFPILVSGAPGNAFADSWTAKFYNNYWQANVNLTISASQKGQQLALVTDARYGSVRKLDFKSATGGVFKVAVTVSGVSPLISGFDNAQLKIVGRWKGQDWVEASSFETELRVAPPGGGQRADTAFEIVVYKKTPSGDQWVAGDALIYVVIQGS